MPKAKSAGVPAPVFMLHQLAHVELNAIDLAWDTVARFARLGLPRVRPPSPFAWTEPARFDTAGSAVSAERYASFASKTPVSTLREAQ